MASPSCIARRQAVFSRRNKQQGAPTLRSNRQTMKASCLVDNEGTKSRQESEYQQWELNLADDQARSHKSLRSPRKNQALSVSRLGVILGCGLALLLSNPVIGLQTETPAAILVNQQADTTTNPSGGEVASPLGDAQAPQVSNSSKLKPVNFSLVDELFESSLDDDQVVQHWRRMDAQLQDGMRSILKMVFPQIVAISQDAKVSGDCSGGILKWILSLRNLRSWAIKMLDALGKPTAGIFEGSLTMFGNYRQCLNIRAPDEDEIEISDQFEEYFRGQFCVLHMKPWMPYKKPFYHLNSTIDSLLRKNYKYYEKTLYDELAEIAIAFNFVDIRMDLCVPSTCSIADIQRVADLLSRKLEMRAKVMRCDIQSRETSIFNQVDRVTMAWLVAPVTLIVLVLLSSLAAFVVGRKSQTSESNVSSARKVLGALSVQAALEDRLSGPEALSLNLPICQLEKLTDKPLPLYSLRSLFIFWYIVVQMTVELNYQYLRESLVLRNLVLNYWPFQIIVNSSLMFESIILITAFTFGYSSLDYTLKDLVRRIMSKYVRLTLPIIFLIALTIATPLLEIESPLWRNFAENQSTVCKSTGLVNLFFLQNFIPYDKICLPHTWIFCVEMQLCLLSIPLLLLLKRTHISCEDTLIVRQSDELKKSHTTKNSQVRNLFITAYCKLCTSRIGLFGILAIIFGSLVNFLYVYQNELPASWFYTFPDLAHKNYYFGSYLTKTWTHLSAFAIGLLAGHLCRSTLRLRGLNLSHELEQPSPVSNSNARMHTLSSNASTSTVMAMELDAQKTDDSFSEGRSSSSTTTGKQTEAPMRTGSRIVSATISISALTCMAGVIFSTFGWSTGEQQPSALVAALYDAGSRLLWSLALVALMIQLCSPNPKTNRFSHLASLLSHPFLVVLGRLSFLVYLLAPYVHNFVLAVEEQSMFPSLFMIFHVIIGNIVITYLIAFLVAIVVEQPARRLFTHLILNCKRSIDISHLYPSGYPKS